MRAIGRVSIAVAAAALAAWFGLGAIQAHDTARAQSLLASSRLSPSQVRQVRLLLRSAGTLNPDRTVDILRGQLAAKQHDYRRAEGILESVTRAEPLNLAAWQELSTVAYRSRDFRLAAAAFRHLQTLIKEPK